LKRTYSAIVSLKLLACTNKAPYAALKTLYTTLFIQLNYLPCIVNLQDNNWIFRNSLKQTAFLLVWLKLHCCCCILKIRTQLSCTFH